MATEIDATIRLGMDQAYAANHQVVNSMFSQAAARFNTVAGFIDQQAQYEYLSVSKLVGAKASGALETAGLSRTVLDHNAAAGQPFKAPNATP